jgi:hypothetical protein
VKRPVIIAVAVIAFLAIAFFVTRWLNNDTVERGDVVTLLKAQARGDLPAMLRVLRCADAACVAVARADSQKLHGTGEVKIAFYTSGTAHAVTDKTKPTRVVWYTPDRLAKGLTTVQCVLVRRSGNVLAGASITLLRLSATIGHEASCP